MDAIRMSVEIGADRRLVIDLPPDTPTGQAELILRPHVEKQVPFTNSAREAARAKLMAAGALSTAHYAPEDTQLASPEELKRVWELFSQGRSSDDLINEDRGLIID